MFMLQGDKEMLDEHYYQLKIEQWYVVIFIRAYNQIEIKITLSKLYLH